MNTLLDLLEKCSAWLDRISKPMERKMAYFFCVMQIVVCFAAIFMALGFFIYNFINHTAFDLRMVMILVLAVILLILGPYTYMLITRDLPRIRNQKTGQKENAAKNRKIEF